MCFGADDKTRSVLSITQPSDGIFGVEESRCEGVKVGKSTMGSVEKAIR